MRNYRSLAVGCSLLALSAVLLAPHVVGKDKNNKYLCSEQNPGQICSADTTCGSVSSPCGVDIKRISSGASIIPGIPGAKANKPFCVKAGTTVTWKSESKNVGFVVDFGPSSPFETETIIGGSDRQVSLVAKNPGCYKFSAGACVSGESYGMCGETSDEMIVTAGK